MGALYAACGHDVWVGNFAMCDVNREAFDRVIHVHHSQSPTPGRCACWDAARSDQVNLFVRYIDGSSLATALDHDSDRPVSLSQIAAFAAGGRILCHCAAGLCRGPTMAVIAKVARGCTPWQAQHDVAQAMWLGYQHAPQFFGEPLREICRWYWDGKRP